MSAGYHRREQGGDVNPDIYTETNFLGGVQPFSKGVFNAMLGHLRSQHKAAASKTASKGTKSTSAQVKKRPASRSPIASRTPKAAKKTWPNDDKKHGDNKSDADGKADDPAGLIDLTGIDSDSGDDKPINPRLRRSSRFSERLCQNSNNCDIRIKKEQAEEDTDADDPVALDQKSEDNEFQVKICTLRRGTAIRAEAKPTRPELMEKMESLSSELTKIEHTHKVEEIKLRKAKEDLESRLKSVEAERDELKHQAVIEKNARATAEQSMLDARNDERQDLKRKLSETERKLRVSEKKLEEQQKRLDMASKSEPELNSAQITTEILRNALKAKELEVEKERDARQDEAGESARKITELKTRNANLEAEISVIKAEKDELEVGYVDSKAARRALLKQLSEAKDANASLTRELSEAKSQNAELKASQASASKLDSSENPKGTNTTKPADLPSPPSSDLEQRTDNVRKTYFRVKKKYDQITAITHNMCALAKGMNLSSFGEFGSSLKQLKKLIEEVDEGEKG